MRKTARSHSRHTKAVRKKQVRYCDLHCDALTAEGASQVTGRRLREGDCLLQCFAAFVKRGRGFSFAKFLAEKFREMCRGEHFNPVYRPSELKEGEVNALFTVEGGEAIDGDLQNLIELSRLGMGMMTLVWNYPNPLGAPNFPDYDGVLNGSIPQNARQTDEGLTPLGRDAVALMFSLGVLPDVSHGSDRLLYDVAEMSRAAGKPFVASHSGANEVYAHARNLTREQIRTIADCGGVVGLCAYDGFLSPDKSREGQMRAFFAHVHAIIDAGGEDVLAFGSDFDGAPPNPWLKNPADMPRLLEAFSKEFGSRVAEKFAYRNFLRIWKEA